MPANLDLWLTSTGIFLKAVSTMSGQELPERLPDRVDFVNEVTLNRVEGLEALPEPKGAENTAAFLGARYENLKATAARGWCTVWYNPQGAFTPEEMPVQDVELLDLSRLHEIGPVLGNKPRLVQCLAWWEAWEVPENVRRHSRTVARCAYLLAVMLRKRGICLDPILAQRGGLLHDIDKIKTLKQSGAHGQKGAEFLEDQGYPALAEIVSEHVISTILHPNADSRGWEVKLVYFCDKLVEGDRLVPFDERLAALSQRYPHYREMMERAAGPVRTLSDQICSILDIPGHEQLVERLRGLMRT